MTSPRTVWLAEGQSSQRDMLQSLRTLKTRHPLTLIASHRSDRPEITQLADTACREPQEEDTRVLFVLEHARRHRTDLLLTGRNSRAYEQNRTRFADAGIRLFTGAKSVDALDIIDDKSRFTTHCGQHGIPVAGGEVFRNINELEQLLDTHRGQALCVKPVQGIFAQGFWRLDNSADPFAHLYHTDAKKIHPEQFIAAYRRSTMVQERPIAMLLMPYLPGREYSIDMACENGEILLAVTRRKENGVQHIGDDTAELPWLAALIRSLQCDGIISVQSKGDAHGVQHVLEINSRPAGGIGYSTHCGADITASAFAYWCGWLDKNALADVQANIQACTVRPVSSAVPV